MSSLLKFFLVFTNINAAILYINNISSLLGNDADIKKLIYLDLTNALMKKWKAESFLRLTEKFEVIGRNENCTLPLCEFTIGKLFEENDENIKPFQKLLGDSVKLEELNKCIYLFILKSQDIQNEIYRRESIIQFIVLKFCESLEYVTDVELTDAKNYIKRRHIEANIRISNMKLIHKQSHTKYNLVKTPHTVDPMVGLESELCQEDCTSSFLNIQYEGVLRILTKMKTKLPKVTYIEEKTNNVQKSHLTNDPGCIKQSSVLTIVINYTAIKIKFIKEIISRVKRKIKITSTTLSESAKKIVKEHHDNREEEIKKLKKTILLHENIFSNFEIEFDAFEIYTDADLITAYFEGTELTKNERELLIKELSELSKTLIPKDNVLSFLFYTSDATSKKIVTIALNSNPRLNILTRTIYPF